MRPEDRRVVSLLAFLHAIVHGNILAIPIFLNSAWRAEFLADDLTLGVLAAAAYASFGIGSVPFGHLADRLRASRLLIVCTAGISSSMLAVAASSGLLFLGISLGALGLFSGIYHPTGLALISRSVREQGRGMGWHGMGGSLGIALGPAFVSGLLSAEISWRVTAALLALPAAAGVALLARFRIPGGPHDSGGQEESPEALVGSGFVLVLLVYMFAGVAYWGSLTFLPRFVGAGNFTFLLALGAIGQVASGTVADRGHPARVLFALSGVAAALLLALAAGEGTALFVVAAWAFGFVLFSLEPLQNTLVTVRAPHGLRGLAFGLTFLSVFGLGSSGAVLAGWLLARDEPAVLFAILAGFLMASGASGLASASIRNRGSRTDS